MAFQLAEAFVELNTRGFRGVMGSIRRVQSGMGSLVGFATGPLGAALSGLGGASAIGGMVRTAASIETTEAQFKTLLGSTEAAKQKMEELQNFAASTPFQFDSLASAAKTLLAFGTSNEQVIPTMQMLGDVAAATGNQVGELANIYGKVQSRGALMTESLDQFNERGIPLGNKLAEMFGKTGEEIRQMASDGEISFADMQRAMQSMTDEGGMAAGGMAAQAGTLSGVWSTLKDNVSLLMGDVGKAIVEGFDLKSATTNITSFVQRVSNQWVPFIVESFGRLNENLVKPFFSMIGGMTDSVMNFVADFDLYWQYAYTSLANSMINMWQHVSTFFANAVTIGEWFVSSTVQLFANLFNNASQIFPAIGEAIATHFSNGVELAKWYVSSVIQFYGNLYTRAGDIFGALVDQITSAWESVLNFFKTGSIEFDFSPLNTAFNAAIDGIEPPKLKGFDTSALKDSMNAAFEGINAPKLITAQTDLMQGDLDRIAGKLSARQQKRQDAIRKRQNEDHSEKVNALKVEGDQQKKNDDEKKKGQASFMSLASLAEKMQQQLFDDKKKGKAGIVNNIGDAKPNGGENAPSKSPEASAAGGKSQGGEQAFSMQRLVDDINRWSQRQVSELRTHTTLLQRLANETLSNRTNRGQSSPVATSAGVTLTNGPKVKSNSLELSLMQRQTIAVEGLLNVMTRSGIKISSNGQTGISIPEGSFQFGGTS